MLRDHGGSGCLYPFGTGGYPACYQCGVASAQCGGIGSPGAVVPLCQVTLLASFPVVAPRLPWKLGDAVGLFLDPPLCLPVPVCVMCDVTTCAAATAEQIVDIPVPRGGQDLPSAASSSGLPGTANQGFFSHFSPCKKVRRWVRTRVRGCAPVSAHPRRRLSWRVSSLTRTTMCG